MSRREWGVETRMVHAGRPVPRIEGAAVPPIFQCAVFEQPEERADYYRVRYPRLNNLPEHIALGKKLAALERAEDAMVTSSGMAAISTSLLELLDGGGHLLIQEQLYGGTHALVVEDFKRYGVEFDFVPPDDPDTWKRRLRANTRGIYVETMTNPLLRVADHAAVVAFAREHDLVSIVDNTFATPVNFRPIEAGYDLVLHSCTKYLNGHSDVIAGAVIGSTKRIKRIRHLMAHLGGTLDPHACFLLDRGLKTLALRVRRQNGNALAIADFLAGHARVKQVNYPGLETHPDHVRARELFDGYGGMLSFVPEGGLDGARRFLKRVEIPIEGPSLGGVETLVTRPVTTSHANLTSAERDRLGIGEELIRVSVGIETTEDLIGDFEAALD